ncbi:GAF domain-containing protein [Thiorhodococcus mannitoliphagus]|uniref:GAF domain-containing protein n=1 Tax=Thiorhodococcus mannitoliphagus TaxID=329406 RepID=A0A6P1E0Y3_9GAMM|nr:sigma 54-interacting transcriptional regulator [Thiorhodococcus mannitoliphagus]NEX22132.1 GAF domain-containing protein [Thiorhodococcus mannitoliphagus]
MPSSQEVVDLESSQNADDSHFEDLLTHLALSFVNVEPLDLDELLIASLRRSVRFLGVDRSTLGRYDMLPGQLVTTHSWALPGIEPVPSPVAESHFPFMAAQIRAGHALVWDRVAELPAEAATDRDAFRQLGLRSIAVFPLTAGHEVLGWLSFSTVRQDHLWSRDQVRRLRLLAGVFANALLRQRKDLELNAAMAENLALRRRVEAENAVWREQVLHCHDFDDLVGGSQALRRVLKQVEQVAPTDSTVLILGETGTGKELIATAIHQRSRRAERPLIRVNCAALPATLIESELFGHEKGAFTGAISRKVGRFEVADGGTLVLDEIGELPMELQPKLLRVLQSGEFERLGSTTTRRTDARVIASTNRDLLVMAREGGFRPDLFYRLGVFPITVPPLRERKEDIALLTAYFVDRLRAKLGRQITRIPDEAIAVLMQYDWPGNVRELENIVERSMILSPGQSLLVDGLPTLAKRPSMLGCADDAADDWRTLSEVERDHILSVCERCGWRINGAGNAAERLGINPNTLRSRMNKLGVSRPAGSASRLGTAKAGA